MMKVEGRAHRMLTQDANSSHTYFLSSRRKLVGSYTDEFLLMDHYPISMEDWYQLNALPLNVLKLQMNMIVRSV